MDDVIYCLVDAGGDTYLKDGAGSYADVAADYGLDEADCEKYRFELATRRMQWDSPAHEHEGAARACFEAFVGTPDRLITFAGEGHLPKRTLAQLLVFGRRRSYLEACAALEHQYTDGCAPANGPCLESGCAAEGEVCLQPLVRAGVEYQKACATEWARWFAIPGNRIDAWKS
jgi:hypothetical protein